MDSVVIPPHSHFSDGHKGYSENEHLVAFLAQVFLFHVEIEASQY